MSSMSTLLAAASAVALGVGVSATQAAEVKSVVLVHGGFVDGSGWQGVYDILKKDG
jgi:opacity protein-like surface antigen